MSEAIKRPFGMDRAIREWLQKHRACRADMSHDQPRVESIGLSLPARYRIIRESRTVKGTRSMKTDNQKLLLGPAFTGFVQGDFVTCTNGHASPAPCRSEKLAMLRELCHHPSLCRR